MKPNRKDPSHKCLIQFHKGFSNLEDLRSEISSCLVTEKNLWLSYDEDAGIERLTATEKGYGYHKHYELTDFLIFRTVTERPIWKRLPMPSPTSGSAEA